MKRLNTIFALLLVVAAAFAQGTAALPTADDLIKDQPKGVLFKNMYRHANVYMAYGSTAMNQTYDGYASDLVVSADGKKMYLKDPFVKFAPGTWIVGDINSDGTVDFKFPQIVCHENIVGGVTGYAYKMSITSDNIGIDNTTQTVSFKWTGDKLTQVNDKDIIGLTNSNGEWLGYGALETSFTEVTDFAAKPADATKAQTYRMMYSDRSGSVQTASVRVVIDGTNVYVGDFLQPDCWVKGTLSGGKVSFAGPQYLGIYKSVHAYMIPLNPTNFQQLQTIDFDYDAATGTMSSQSAMLVNVGKQNLSALDIFSTPYLQKTDFTVGTPAAPKITGFMKFGAEDPTYGSVEYELSTLSTTGKQLNQDNLYYNIYADGNLITFEKSKYSYIKADMTDVPYGYSDSYTDMWTGQKGFDFITDSGKQTIFIYTPFTRIGVKAVYVDGDKRYESAMTEYPASTGIDNATDDNGNVEKSVQYRDLQGRKVVAPSNGIFIKTVEYGNGETKTVKVLK